MPRYLEDKSHRDACFRAQWLVHEAAVLHHKLSDLSLRHVVANRSLSTRLTELADRAYARLQRRFRAFTDLEGA